MRKKKTSLVSQYLERISGHALEEYQVIFRAFARHRNGVYALYHKNRLYYVGLAKNLSGRLKAHLRDRHSNKWDRFSIYLTIGDDHIRELESLLMRIAKPTGNRQLGKFPNAQNLRREFARQIRVDAKQHLDALLGKDTKANDNEGRQMVNAKRGLPVMSKWLSVSTRLRATFKGKPIKARVRRDGRITFKGKHFNSPSLAAHAAIGRKRPINGWSFWTYERAPGDWVKLSELRR
jgi:hypothetical protein